MANPYTGARGYEIAREATAGPGHFVVFDRRVVEPDADDVHQWSWSVAYKPPGAKTEYDTDDVIEEFDNLGEAKMRATLCASRITAFQEFVERQTEKAESR